MTFLLNNHFEGRKSESEKDLHIYSKYLQVPYSLPTQNQIGTGHTLIWTFHGYFHSNRKDVLRYLFFYLIHEEIVDINFTFDKQLMAILTDWFSEAPSLLRYSYISLIRFYYTVGDNLPQGQGWHHSGICHMGKEPFHSEPAELNQHF